MLFEGVDLALEPRIRACLVGRNGAGKSTLIRVLTGEIEVDGGERFITPGAQVIRVSQEPDVTGLTLLDYAASGGAPAHDAAAELQAFGLDPHRTTQGLSGGEARRAALARAFASDPDVLLLDEPTNHLDILSIETLQQRIGQCRAAVLVVSHDRAFLERVTKVSFWLAGAEPVTLAELIWEGTVWGMLTKAAGAAETCSSPAPTAMPSTSRGVSTSSRRRIQRRLPSAGGLTVDMSS